MNRAHPLQQWRECSSQRGKNVRRSVGFGFVKHPWMRLLQQPCIRSINKLRRVSSTNKRAEREVGSAASLGLWVTARLFCSHVRTRKQPGRIQGYESVNQVCHSVTKNDATFNYFPFIPFYTPTSAQTCKFSNAANNSKLSRARFHVSP